MRIASTIHEITGLKGELDYGEEIKKSIIESEKEPAQTIQSW
jgi:hypothetical protein